MREIRRYDGFMRRLWGLLFAGFVVVSCGGSSSRPKVNPADLDAWRGIPIIELETHPVFSVQRRTVRELSDGSQMWIFSRCFDEGEDCAAVVTRSGNLGTARTHCSSGTSCCHNQFIIRKGTVERREVIGPCFTTCDGRPASRPCESG